LFLCYYIIMVTETNSASEEGLVWLERESPATASGVATEWEPFSRYLKEYEHPLWQEWGALAEGAGHGGGDFFVLLEFVSAVEGRKPPRIDVYDAVTWSAITPLSEQSLAAGNVPVEIPDFRRKRR